MCAQMCACIELCRAGLCDGVSSGAPVEEVRRADVVVCPVPQTIPQSHSILQSHSIPQYPRLCAIVSNSHIDTT